MNLPNFFFDRPWTRPVEEASFAPDAELQWWYFDAVLDSGHRLLTFFLPRFTGSIAGNEFGLPILDVALSSPEGETIRERRFFRPSELVASRDRFAAEFGREGSVAFEPPAQPGGLGLYRLRTRTGRIRCDLEIAPEVPPWAPTRSGHLPRPLMIFLSRSLTTRDYVHYVACVPRGRLRGRITVDGKVLEARGTAYHEQGRLNFCLARLCTAWYWLHIEHPPWTILSGTLVPPPGVPRPRNGVLGGMGFVQKGGECLLAAFDPTGVLVRWPVVESREPGARDGEKSMAWNADVRLGRPGLSVRVAMRSSEVLEYIPFAYREQTPRHPCWGQTLVDAEVQIVHKMRKSRFTARGLLETMVTGSGPR
jgi:hypothetical protein